MAWAPDYASLAEGRAYLRITDAGDTAQDADISRELTNASRAIDAHCNRQFGAAGTSQTREYTAQERYLGTNDYLVDIDDLSSASGLTVTSTPRGGSPTTITDAELRPLNADVNGGVYTTLILPTAPSLDGGAIAVASPSFGWAAVPTPIKAACLLQMSRWVKRRDAPFGIAGSPDMGSEMRLLAELDVDVKVMLRGYVRHWA